MATAYSTVPTPTVPPSSQPTDHMTLDEIDALAAFSQRVVDNLSEIDAPTGRRETTEKIDR